MLVGSANLHEVDSSFLLGVLWRLKLVDTQKSSKSHKTTHHGIDQFIFIQSLWSVTEGFGPAIVWIRGDIRYINIYIYTSLSIHIIINTNIYKYIGSSPPPGRYIHSHHKIITPSPEMFDQSGLVPFLPTSVAKLWPHDPLILHPKCHATWCPNTSEKMQEIYIYECILYCPYCRYFCANWIKCII